MGITEYISSAWEQLWFLRPEWFWAMVPIGLIGLMFLVSRSHSASWKKAFPKELLPHLTIQGTKRQFVIPKLLLLILLAIMTLGMSGPTWTKIEQPGNRTEAVMVVLLDVSRSMASEDIPPNRLDRAKLKLKDLFAAQPGVRIALAAFAGSVHLVVPFTKDYKTIDMQIESLTPGIIPLGGSNLHEALDFADTLLSKIEAPSTILLVTDNLNEQNINRIAQSSAHTQLEIMVIGTPGGAVVPGPRGPMKDQQGNQVISRLDLSILETVGGMEGVNIVPVTLDDSDVRIMASHLKQNLEFTPDSEQAEEEWIDYGYYCLFPLVFFALFWFRRGWMVHLGLVTVLITGCSSGDSITLKNLFWTPDQKASRMYQKGNTEQAATMFSDPSWKGYAYSKAGNLESAIEAYSEDVSATGFYNLGVTYSQMGDLQAAQEAFATALELDPSLTVAKNNLAHLEAIADSLAQTNKKSENQTTDDDQEKEFQESTELPDEKDKPIDSDQTYKGKGDAVEMAAREVDEDQIDVFEFDPDAVISQDDARQTLLRQVTEDPAIFLRRKFAYQNRLRKDLDNNQDPW